MALICDCAALLAQAGRFTELPRGDRLTAACDALWKALGDAEPDASRRTVSWIGFYHVAKAGNDQGVDPGAGLLLDAHRDKPACSPIGMHGACGQAFSGRRTLIVTDVAHLGEGYVACDPRDRSELVIPMFDDRGEPWGVLDADSFAAGAFDEGDADLLEKFCVDAGLTRRDSHPVAREIV